MKSFKFILHHTEFIVYFPLLLLSLLDDLVFRICFRFNLMLQLRQYNLNSFIVLKLTLSIESLF